MDIKIGFYKHFKGGIYEVVGVAKHSENPEDEYVVYKHDDGEMWVRPVAIFAGTIERDGETKPRFEFVGESV